LLSYMCLLRGDLAVALSRLLPAQCHNMPRAKSELSIFCPAGMRGPYDAGGTVALWIGLFTPLGPGL
jgi:hypothetical protein